MPLFTEHFNIPQNQPIEFVDIPLDGDLFAFICPFLIANNRQTPLYNNIFSQLKAFFVKLNRDFIVPNDAPQGLAFLSQLHEPNEYHLGYSSNNKGRAISNEKSEQIFGALRNNRFARQGAQLTNEAHNILLLVKGIGQDIMSDSISNICRNIFAQFTLDQCVIHNINTTPTQFHYYDDGTGQWTNMNFDLPHYNGKPIILIPKALLSGSRSYPSGYNNFVAGNYISPAILSGQKQVNNQGRFVRTLANGTRIAIIKAVRKEFGKTKEDLVDFVVEYQGSLDSFVDYAKTHYPALDLSAI